MTVESLLFQKVFGEHADGKVKAARKRIKTDIVEDSSGESYIRLNCCQKKKDLLLITPISKT